MRSQTWKSCLGVMCLLAAGTANAAKISFSDKGYIDVGALIQTQFRMIQDGSPDKNNPSYDFLFNRARILLSGQFDDHIGFIIDTDVTAAATRDASGASAMSPNAAGSPTVPTSWPARLTQSRRLFSSAACVMYARSPVCDSEKSTRPRLPI